MVYKILASNTCIKKITDDGSVLYIPPDEANTDWQEYQAWLAADPINNIPEEE